MADLSSYINIAANTVTAVGNISASGGASPAPTLSGFSSLSAADSISVGNANIYSNGYFSANTANFSGNISANNLGNIVSVNTDGNASNILFGNGVFAAVPAATTMDITDTNGLATTYYPTFVENRTTGQTVRADQDLSYRTDTNTLTVGNVSVGNVTASGTSSNVVRRAFGLVDYDVTVTLDDLSASVTNSPTGQLKLQTSGSWQGTGWTETFQGGGTPSVTNWVNLPLNTGFSPASGAMSGQQGYGCRCVIGDQTPSAKLYQITVTKLGTTGNQWAISIERLV